MPKESILDEAKRIVHGDRGENYGHPFEDFLVPLKFGQLY
jgi:hypothetical protein